MWERKRNVRRKGKDRNVRRKERKGPEIEMFTRKEFLSSRIPCQLMPFLEDPRGKSRKIYNYMYNYIPIQRNLLIHIYIVISNW